jgi:uncharacterized protein YegL
MILKNFFIYFFCIVSIFMIKNASMAEPNKYKVNGTETGWYFPLDGKPMEEITKGFMCEGNGQYVGTYHYAQDFDYNENSVVYAMADGEIEIIRKSGGYGGGDPCNSEYNSFLVKYDYEAGNGSIKPVYVFYGHVKDIKGEGNCTETTCDLDSTIEVEGGERIARLNDPSCQEGMSPHLHLTVLPEDYEIDGGYYDGYNDDIEPNGRARPFKYSGDCLKSDSFFATYKPYQKISTALVLDHSGSMKGKKLEKALKAAEAYFKGMRPDDSGALSIFSTDAKTKISMSDQQSVLSSMDQVLSQVSATHNTNIGAGLEKGYAELKKTSSQSGHKAAVLLSDGRNNRGDWKPIIDKFTQKDWRIFTVGFGDDADVKTLRSIAEQTGGVYSFAQTIDVINAYQEISAQIQNKSVLLAVNEFLGPNGKLTYQVPVGTNSEALNVYTNWQGSELKNVLTSPDGKRYSKQNLHGDTGRLVEGDVYQMLEVRNPKTGDWKIETSWDEPPPSPEQVNISISEKTDIFANILSFRSQYTRNDPVVINVQAAEVANAGKKVRLSDTQVQAEVLNPGQELIRMVQARGKLFTMYKDVQKDLTRTVKLFDDGQHHDYKAGDGIFGNVFHETDLNGGYLVTAYVTGQKQNGDQVERTLKASFQVGPISQNQVTNSQVVNFFDSTQDRSKGLKTLKKSRNLLEQRRQNDPAQRIQKMQDSSAADNINKLLQGDK